MSSGLSGYAMSHSDIGGYSSFNKYLLVRFLRSDELLRRWMELSALSDAIFRTHEGNLPELDAQIWDEPGSLAHFAWCARMHVSLAPYRETLLDDVTLRGLPLVRHPFLHYPSDAATYALVEQFMLGPHLMVCPALRPSLRRVRCYLPERSGRWVQVWQRGSLSAEGGAWVACDAPRGQPCVWVREDASQLPELEAFLNFTSSSPPHNI